MPYKYARSPGDYLRVVANYTKELNANGNQRPNVVMIHMGRSGSTVLGDLIGQRPDIHWDLEVLMRKRINRYARMVPFRQKILNDPNRIVHWRMLLAEKPIYGFEVMPHQVERFNVELPEYLAGLLKLGIRHAIVLERKNTIRLAISRLYGMRKGRWQKRDSVPVKSKKEPLTINFEDVYGYGRSLMENLDYFSDLNEKVIPMLGGFDVLRLTYEDDILPSPIIGYDRCCQFLNLPEYEEVSIQFKKLNPYPVKEMIENFDEVENYLAGSRYQQMLYD